MHLFVAGWGLSPDQMAATAGELGRTSRLYPLLDHSAMWHRRFRGGVLVGGVASPASTLGPRRYVHEDADEIVLYDGLPLDPTGESQPYRANVLAGMWDRLPERVEGRYVAIRVSTSPSVRIELVVDPIGVEQVYVYERHGMSLISNSAGLIQRTLRLTEPDPLGVSLFLLVDHVGANRTLREGIEVLPGGQFWTWRLGDREWQRRTYWAATDHAAHPDQPVTEALVRETTTFIGDLCREAARVDGVLNAPITGGRDSRMAAAILMNRGIPARFWTKGDADSIDVTIGRQFAQQHGLPHRIANRPTQREEGRDPTLDIGAEWESLAPTFVAQNDGLPSLMLIGNIQGQPDRIEQLEVTLSAMCAESTRGVHHEPEFLVERESLGHARRLLAHVRTSPVRGFQTPAAYRLAHQYVERWTTEIHEAGVAIRNLPLAWYHFERCRRWATNNPRELAQTEEKFLPFLTRRYVEVAFSLRPEDRLLRRFHHEALRILLSGSESDPPFDQPERTSIAWPPNRRRLQNRIVTRLPWAVLRGMTAARDRVRPPTEPRVAWSPYDEESWIESNLGWTRDVVFARPASPLWQFVNRRQFEHLLSSATETRERRVHQLPIFAAITMFLLEAMEADWLASPAEPVRVDVGPSPRPQDTSTPLGGASRTT